MPTECSAEHFDFGTVEARAVEAAVDGWLVSSDAGALLLGATDRAIGLIDRFAACFHDERREDLIEHEVATLVGQRVFGIALGCEDLNDHDELRHDPMMGVLAGKLEARREDCAPVAGKSTLNRLELSRLEPTRYHRISHNSVAIKRVLVDLFLEAHKRAPTEIILDLDATDDPLHGDQEGRFLARFAALCRFGAKPATADKILADQARKAAAMSEEKFEAHVAKAVTITSRCWPSPVRSRRCSAARMATGSPRGFCRDFLSVSCSTASS